MKASCVRTRSVVAVLAALSLGLAAPRALAATVTNTWAVDAPGNWMTPGNWSGADIPTNAGDVANLTLALAATRTVTVNAVVKLGALRVLGSGSGASGKVYNLASGTGASLTMDSGGSANARVEQLSGGGQNTLNPACGFALASDLDLLNFSGNYMNIGPFSGSRDIHVNRTGGTGTPYVSGNNTGFYGNWVIYAGGLMWTGEPFGNTTTGTRTITIQNNAILRCNGTSTLAANRRIVVGSGGGNIRPNARNLTLPAADQLAGSGALLLSDQNSGVFTLGGANDAFTGVITVSGSTSITNRFALGASGSVRNCGLIHLSATTGWLDVAAKTAGYDVPTAQVVAGIGRVNGRLNVTAATGVVHPGTYTLPGPVTNPGKLAVTNGVTFANGGAYLWDLKNLKDDSNGTAGTDFAQLNVTGGAVSLAGGAVTPNFVGTAATSGPASGNVFWKSAHTWTILTAAAPPSGTLAVNNAVYGVWGFHTEVSGNTLKLVYGRVVSGTVMMLR